jgi:hypothetical protein
VTARYLKDNYIYAIFQVDHLKIVPDSADLAPGQDRPLGTYRYAHCRRPHPRAAGNLLTQDELGRKAGISKGFLSNLENSSCSVGLRSCTTCPRQPTPDHLDRQCGRTTRRRSQVAGGIAQRRASRSATRCYRSTPPLHHRARTPGKKTPRLPSTTWDWRRFYEAVELFL